MSPSFTLTEIKSRLEQNVYTFRVSDNLKVHLSGFQHQTRESPRHKFKTVAHYDRIYLRDSTIKKQPTVPDAVLHEVLKDIQNSIVYEEA